MAKEMPEPFKVNVFTKPYSYFWNYYGSARIYKSVEQIRRVFEDNLGIIFVISP